MGRDSADLIDDLLRGSRPLEGLTITVPVLDERLNLPVESLHRPERATPDQFPRENTIPDLNLIHPRRTGRGGRSQPVVAIELARRSVKTSAGVR